MSLRDDLTQIVEFALPTDPSFRRVDQARVTSCIKDAQHCATDGDTEAFLWSAMRLLALPGNGHTRLIPNDAIRVLPLRFVSMGNSVQLSYAPPGVTGVRGELRAVNGTPVSQIETAAARFLAGTPQRKRVIGALLFAWPYALARLGVSPPGDTIVYRIQDETGQITDLTLDPTQSVPAATLYPTSEHGRADPNWHPTRFVELQDWHENGLSIGLPSFFDLSETALQHEIAQAAAQVGKSAKGPILLDLRGNTGGDFLKTMPLIDAISRDPNRQVVAMVDKFTFSAAIVFVAILKHRLGNRLKLIGEEMGDGLTFFAEGGMLALPASGAAVRYSTAFHDWQNGTADDTTPPEIAQHLVAAGELGLDRDWEAGLLEEESQIATYQRILATYRP